MVLLVSLLVEACGSSEETTIEKTSIDTLAGDSTRIDSIPPAPRPFQEVTVFFSGGTAEGEYLHIELPNLTAAQRINAHLDSIANLLVGYPLAPYIENPTMKDSLEVRMKGEITMSFRPATYHAGLVSFSFFVRRFGQKGSNVYMCRTFDIESGQPVTLEQLVVGGSPAMLQGIRQHLISEDRKTRYECSPSPQWNAADDFSVTPEGLRWELDETVFPDRQFCPGIHLLMPWTELQPMLKKDNQWVEKLLKSEN